MTEYSNKEDLNEENQLKFNNNSTVLLTEGQILALRNRGINVPFNTPGQTELTEEQIKAINGAGISTADLTEPGNKTVEELTGMKDPTQPEERKPRKKPIFREFEEVKQSINNFFDRNNIDENEQIIKQDTEKFPPLEESSKHL